MKIILCLLSALVVAAGIVPLVKAQDALPGNGNASFGGAIGKGSLSVSDDGTTVKFELTRGAGGLNDALVIYIDSKEGGFATTETFDDKSDEGRKSISGFDGTHRSVLKFAAGFEADYAIAVQPEYAELFSLSKTGPHNWVESGSLSPKGDGNAAKFTFFFKRSSFGGSSSPLKISTTYINPKDAYRSDEADGNTLAGTAADDHKNFGYNPVEASFVTLKSER